MAKVIMLKLNVQRKDLKRKKDKKRVFHVEDKLGLELVSVFLVCCEEDDTKLVYDNTLLIYMQRSINCARWENCHACDMVTQLF